MYSRYNAFEWELSFWKFVEDCVKTVKYQSSIYIRNDWIDFFHHILHFISEDKKHNKDENQKIKDKIISLLVKCIDKKNLKNEINNSILEAIKYSKSFSKDENTTEYYAKLDSIIKASSNFTFDDTVALALALLQGPYNIKNNMGYNICDVFDFHSSFSTLGNMQRYEAAIEILWRHIPPSKVSLIKLKVSDQLKLLVLDENGLNNESHPIATESTLQKMDLSDDEQSCKLKL